MYFLGAFWVHWDTFSAPEDTGWIGQRDTAQHANNISYRHLLVALALHTLAVAADETPGRLGTVSSL